MLSKSWISLLALTSAVSASPALRRSDDPCQDAYKACIAAGTPEVACSCTLTACLGEDNARNREYCASATANLPRTTSAPASTKTTAAPSSASACTTDLFWGCNPARSSCPNGPGTFYTVTPSTFPTSVFIGCNPAHTSCSEAGTMVTLTSRPTFCYSSTSSAAPAATTMSTKASSAAPSSKAATTANTQVPVPTSAAGTNPKKVGDKTWDIKNLIRYCGEGNKGCDYNFDLVANGQTQHCTIVRMPGGNAATESWSNQVCTSGSDYHISWGYVENPAPAYAVITVVGKQGNELALDSMATLLPSLSTLTTTKCAQCIIVQ